MNLNLIKSQIEGSISVKQALLSDAQLTGLIDEVATVVVAAYKSGNKTTEFQHLLDPFYLEDTKMFKNK